MSNLEKDTSLPGMPTEEGVFLPRPSEDAFALPGAQPAEMAIVVGEVNLSLADADPASAWGRARALAGKHKGKLALGACAASIAMTFYMNPYEEVENRVITAAPWVGTGVVVSESMFVAGLGIMGASVGAKMGANPLKWRARLPEISEKADNSLLYKTGFWTNTAGAVGTALAVSAGTLTYLPPESYGVLGFAAADLSLTYAVRTAMISGVRNNVAKKQQ